MIEASKKDDLVLEKVSCIYYPVWFKKDKVKALINFGSEINTIIQAYILKLNLKIRSTNVQTQKINNSILEKFEMVLTSF